MGPGAHPTAPSAPTPRKIRGTDQDPPWHDHTVHFEEACLFTHDAAALRGPITVTAAYFVLWYAMLFGLQTRTKYRLRREYAARGEVFDRYRSMDPEMMRGDRAVQNTHEQMGPFLTSMWMYAAFVSPDSATWLGTTYVALRAAYPLLLGPRVEQVQPKRVAFVTLPCYAIIAWMLGSAVAAAWTGSAA